VSIKEDKEVIVGKIKKFVDGMNGVFQFIQAQNKLDKDSDTTRTLGGDSVLRDVEGRLRGAIQNPVVGISGSIKYLNQLGIQFTRDGVLSFDEEKFNATISKNLPDVTEFFIGDNANVGLVPQLKNSIQGLLDNVSGPLTNRHNGIQTKITQIDQQITNKERLLTQKEESLKNQFSRLEETMARLKSQGQFLQARLGGGGDGGGGFNLQQTSG
jgi:flagellar hook-associated protein 2